MKKIHLRRELERNLSLLGLPLAIHLNTLTSSVNNDYENNVKKNKKDIVGGRERDWYEPFQDQILTYTASSPITTIHIATGATLHLLKSFGIADYNYLLYHPSKILIPKFQVHRTITGNFVFGKSLYEVIHRAYNFITYGGKLEKYINGRGDTIREKKVYTEGVQRKKEDGSKKTVKEWLLTDNKYLKLNINIVSSLMLADFILSGFGLFTIKSKSYSILPSLEVAITFIWSMVEDETNSQVMGMFNLPPFIMPMVIGFTSGSSFSSIIKGLFAGAYVANSMDIKRSDGEKALQYLNRTSMDFWEMRHILIKTLKKVPFLDVIITEIEKTITRFITYYQDIAKLIKEDPTQIDKITEDIKKHIIEEQKNIKQSIADTKENIKELAKPIVNESIKKEEDSEKDLIIMTEIKYSEEDKESKKEK